MQLIDTFLNFFIPNAEAAVSPAPMAQQSSGPSFVVMIAILLFFMYFVLLRPQNKRMKEQKNLLASLAVGDEVMTAGGVLGTIHKLSDNYVVLTLSDNVNIMLQKSSVVAVLPKGTLSSI